MADTGENKQGSGTVAAIVKITLVNGILVGLLFGAAGRLDWVRAWILLGLLAVTFGVNLVGIKLKNPQLFRERWKKRKDTKPFDKVFAAFYVPGFLALPVVAGLDAVRFGWSPVSAWHLYVGFALHVLGAIPLFAALTTNPHLETTVRIQKDRGHRVITTGPYRFVRHPMYTGVLLMYAGWPLILGSLWSYVVFGVILVSFVVRTALEDRALRAELEGYEAYARRTRYRLLPGVW